MSGRGTSYRAMDWAWSLKIPPSHKLVVVNLAGRVDQAYSCFPSLSTIAEDTQLSKATVARVIGFLEKGDILVRATRQRANGSSRSTRYYLNHPEAPHVTGDFDPEDDPQMAEELRQAAGRAIGLSHGETVPLSHGETVPCLMVRQSLSHGETPIRTTQ